MATKKRKRTLKSLREDIAKEVPFVDIKPYSHNIISLVLMQISSEYGAGHANKAIRDFGLEERGWRQRQKR